MQPDNETNSPDSVFRSDRSVVWCDFNAKFLEKDGTLPRTLFADLLHPTAAGYRIWADAVTDILHAR